MMQVSKQETVDISVMVNGKKFQESSVSRKLLSDFLRDDCGLTGTHVGCEHGVCGACTVMVNGHAVRSCLMFAVQVNGAEIMTVEGLAETELGHELQCSFTENHALQCGFCTPGILMSASEFLNENGAPSERQISEMLSGHLCRCTGYKSIVQAIQATARKLDGGVR